MRSKRPIEHHFGNVLSSGAVVSTSPLWSLCLFVSSHFPCRASSALHPGRNMAHAYIKSYFMASVECLDVLSHPETPSLSKNEEFGRK